jgi:rsbT co-antagonist protein RsbR
MSMSNAPPANTESNSVQSDLLLSVDQVLSILKAVGEGDLSGRLELNFPDTHPVGALAASVNSMIEALGEARTNSAQYLLELNDKIETIERQRLAIDNLSVPIIEVWTGVLCAPIVGMLDSERASQVTMALLNAIVEKKAEHAIIDITGIEMMDTQSADHFLRMARAVSLLGTRCALSGVHPRIARTIVHMGVELQGLKSYRTMRDALRHSVKHAARARANGRA